MKNFLQLKNMKKNLETSTPITQGLAILRKNVIISILIVQVRISEKDLKIKSESSSLKSMQTDLI